MTRAIGIDLGTTYTVVATMEAERPRVLPNAEGHRLTPSVVAFTTKGDVLVGQPARAQAASNPHRTVFSIKRRMGSGYRLKIADEEYTPQMISSLILKKAKADAEVYLGERIDQAVITVPAYFDDRQRQATKEAGALAGLDVIRIINEPTSATLAYGLLREDAHTVLVWDLGGGTFDVSVLELGEGIFEVRAVNGDTWLGGDDFDQRLMDHLATEYKKVTGDGFPLDAGAWQILREAAEAAKVQLSSLPQVQINLPPLGSHDSAEVGLTVTRQTFERVCDDLIQHMVLPTRQALADAGLSPEDIDRVLLVGGASRMPAVRNLARQMLGKEPYRYVNPDEAVAMGAAIQAGMLMGQVQKVVLLDVLPLSLGVEAQGGLAAPVIPRNSPLPASGARVFTTATDWQTSMDIHVLQGERELAVDNISLGRFRLEEIPPAPRGVAKVEVAFEGDVDGIVHVSAHDLLTDNEVRVTVSSTKFLDQREIGDLIDEALRQGEMDQQLSERIRLGNQALNLITAVEEAMASMSSSQSGSLVQTVSALKEALASDTATGLKEKLDELRRLLAVCLREGPETLVSLKAW